MSSERIRIQPTVSLRARLRNLWGARTVLPRFAEPRRLHVGCGKLRFDGWVNIDARRSRAVDLVWDLRCGLPGEDGSAELIYSEHFLEHLTTAQGVGFLCECRRVLCPGGIVRIAMPSLEFVLERATSGHWREQDWLTWPEYQHVATRAEMINSAFRDWGHQWLYDREELERRLREAGFTRLRFMEPQESDHPELRKRESRKDSLLICEAVKT